MGILTISRETSEPVLCGQQGKRFRLAVEPSSAGLAATAKRLGLRQLWLAPAWLERFGGPLDAEGWKRPDWRWVDGVGIAAPARDRANVWNGATDLDELRDGLLAFEWAMRRPWEGSRFAMALDSFGGALGQAETRKGLRPKQAHELPPDDVLGCETDAYWSREPDRDERRRPWVHTYDKHGAHLAVGSDLAVGLGDVRHERPHAFDGSPGYWLVTVDGLRADPRLPDVEPPRPWGEPLQPDAPRWMASATVALAVERGGTVRVHDAYHWPQSGRVLHGWYEQHRDARTKLQGAYRGTESAVARAYLALAGKAVKDSYTALSGVLASLTAKNADPRPWWYRPDVSDGLRAASRANVMRNLYRWAEAGLYPLALTVDAVAVASDDPDPHRAARGVVRFGDGLGEYAVQGSEPMVDWLARIR